MKKLFAIFIAVWFSVAAHGQPEPANYAAVLSRFKVFYNTNKPDSIYKMFGKPLLAKFPTADEFKTSESAIKSQLGALNKTSLIAYTAPMASYVANFDNGPIKLSLALDQAGLIAGLGFSPMDVQAQPASTIVDDPNLIESPVSLKVMSATLSGTLAMPKNITGRVPVVLIIAGSGPTDRDGNNPIGVNAGTYKLLAGALGKNGIATLRYDKRLIGKSISSTKEKDLRFEDYSDDAIALIKMLHDDTRFSKVIVLGHSEGSLIGMLASSDQPVSGYISVAGAGERVDKIITTQLKDQPDYIKNGFKTILDSLVRGKFTDKVDPALYSLMRPSVQPYMLSWMRHDPTIEIKKLKIPVLIIQGTTDIQVTVSDAEKLKKAKSDATLLIIPGMSHILKEGPADKAANAATYKDPNLPLKPELVTGIVDFIKKLK